MIAGADATARTVRRRSPCRTVALRWCAVPVTAVAPSSAHGAGTHRRLPHPRFRPERRFPYRPDTFYAPAGQELGTPARLRTVMDAQGVGHALLVGPNSGYGEDNRCLPDTLAGGAGRYRGMAVVGNGTTRAGLDELRSTGVLGVTLNAALLGVEYYADAAALLANLAALDMIADVQVVDDQLVSLAPLLERSGVRV